ncbi:MAG: HAMP domain-containing protein [Oligoflexia bacterium]|nr:HAMP domain-containing protein [Oligoflexia bacterium]
MSIKTKISLMFGITVALILTGIYFYLNPKLHDITYNNLKGRIQKHAKLVNTIISETVIHTENINRIIKLAGKNSGFRITVIGTDGRILAESNIDDIESMENHLQRVEIQDAINNGYGESIRFSTTLKQKMLYYAIPLNTGRFKGFIRIAMPLSEINSILGTVSNALFFSLLVAFFMSLIISLVVSGIISNPIKKLSLTAKQIAQGNLGSRIIHYSSDEIGELARTFNFMAGQIEARIEEITNNESKLKAILAGMFDGVMVVDNNGDIVFINKSLEKLFNVKNATGKKTVETIRNMEIYELTKEVLSLKREFVSKEIYTDTGESRILAVHASAVSRNGVVTGAVLIFHDITELRRLESIRKDFVANVSHELRTPVSNIKGYAETLAGGAINDKKHALEFSRIILTESDRLIALINDLLDLSRIESGNFTPEFRPCSIKELVFKTLPQVKKDAENKSIKLNVNIPDNVPMLKADANSIVQVLFNIIDNAIKYSHKGSIDITVSADKEFVRTSIKDTGIGIPENEIERIFERFYRVDKARSREAGGTGLGLSIVKHIILSHHGKISVESEPGRGSTFSFTLPVA